MSTIHPFILIPTIDERPLRIVYKYSNPTAYFIIPYKSQNTLLIKRIKDAFFCVRVMLRFSRDSQGKQTNPTSHAIRIVCMCNGRSAKPFVILSILFCQSNSINHTQSIIYTATNIIVLTVKIGGKSNLF